MPEPATLELTATDVTSGSWEDLVKAMLDDQPDTFISCASCGTCFSCTFCDG